MYITRGIFAWWLVRYKFSITCWISGTAFSKKWTSLVHWIWWLQLQYISLVQFSCSVMSDTLPPHGLQQAKLPCPSPTPSVYSNSCPLNQWCHPTISSSVIPFSSCLQSSPASGSFPVSQWVSSSHQVAKLLKLQLHHQCFQWIFRTDFLYDWLIWSPCSPRDSQESSPTPQFKTSILQRSAFFMVQLSHPYMTWKNHSFH